MRLERLEINGFKSFSDRSELAFDKGVTAIVGPNGCGKSNVADAITWVMGEQSAKSLRGDKMEDVIFSGSDARKPTATAEVKLRFSGVLTSLTGPALETHARGGGKNGSNGHTNGHGEQTSNGHDANGHSAAAKALEAAALTRDEAEEVIRSVAREVEVTRRLYRSGESEYLIDGHACRLRDIHDLLMDTGLGAKAYAIIEQGKIGMILSSRATDRRQLIEEAAGITKYKMRRRSAELKLDAAQQNLTRVDDIVFEVEKQRGTLKRQAGKARRYQKLRNEMRRLEKVLFARKYRQLAEAIEVARTRLAEAREREALALARVAEMESDFGRVRIELAERESHATITRETAHARELDINRLQQQLALECEQIRNLTNREMTIASEIDALEVRREPARAAIALRRAATLEAEAERDRAASAAAFEAAAYERAYREIEGLEADVEGARAEVFAAINAATALRHSLEHAASARERVLETLSNLQIESDDLRIERDRAEFDRASAAEGLRRAQEALEETRIAKAARESELASARIEHDWRARSVRTREHELAGLAARLKSLQELQARRAEYGDAPRTLLAEATGRVAARGALADYLEVEPGYERAVEAYLGELLQYVVVEDSHHARAGLELLREAQAGRCGFVIGETPDAADQTASEAGGPQAEASGDLAGLVPLSSVVRVGGPYAMAIRAVIGQAWIAESYDHAERTSARTQLPIVTPAGDLLRGSHVVVGGIGQEAHGILETKREIRELAEQIAAEREALLVLAAETETFEAAIAQASTAITVLGAELHRQEKAIVGLEAQAARASSDASRIELKDDQLGRERRRSEEERDAIERRQHEARASIVTLEDDQRAADERLSGAQRRLFEARDAAESSSRRAAEARATHAALIERAAALAADLVRLEEAAAELESRSISLAHERDQVVARVEMLKADVLSGEARLELDIRSLDDLKTQVTAAEESVASLRMQTDETEQAVREARSAFESIRVAASELDIARVTAEGDLSHLAATCLATVQSTLDEVIVEVEALERDGNLAPDASVIASEETDEEGDAAPAIESAPAPERSVAVQQALSAEEAIEQLRAKIERLGPVNMMAIEQYDELENRYTFLTTQRKDLVDSIAQTAEAIKRIDETTRHRFVEAFGAINRNFQEMFSTLFGGGRAGLTLLDENDPLESGIEIVAQPPGKRLQSVQLLSGGEKALTAISLMFGLFKFKPSPFCLLDEIDAPLDDANIGRFVEMLRSMQEQTQFIIITHSRKTMEIADRLYGVTMEEPGVSKLISVQMN